MKGWVQKFLMGKVRKTFMFYGTVFICKWRLVGNWWMLAEPIDSNFIIYVSQAIML